ncbi:Hsp70 family protein [Flavimaricola marinus]|uniref:Chaperone protein DnaK n=1 Tax=Flavimaricola marinus TaxID=1819565 RepID=A0A238LBI1_9RHOB|nr:Hsp70 family protein [Flavimaricola marinus]SMY07039.1 Chaperone protein DnaK [Flavimaricola marinus]
MTRTDTLAIDFGTSNTAAAVMVAGKPHIIPLEVGAETMPTAIFLDFTKRQTLVGEAAVSALIDGRDGRFMRALKSVLGTPLMHEKRQFLNERLTLIEIVTRLIAGIKARAEAHCGQPFSRVLSGRPVHFKTRDPERDALALADLETCYRAAGFEAVDFLFEPAAAALAAVGDTPGLGLIVDIGGGTSDFSLFTREAGRTEVIASHGIRMGGTDFDRALSIAHVMPLFGKGTGLRAEFGPAVHEAPVALFHDLASWEKIPFLYTGQTLREVARMQKVAEAPEKFARLHSVLEDHLGHDVAFAVERAKIGANKNGQGRIDLGIVEKGLSETLTAEAMSDTLTAETAQIANAASQTLADAGVAPSDVARIVLVGGSSLLSSVSGAVHALMPEAKLEYSNAFTAVVDGLAIAAAHGST